MYRRDGRREQVVNYKPNRTYGVAPIVFLLDCIANLYSGQWTRNCPQNIRRVVIDDD